MVVLVSNNFKIPFIIIKKKTIFANGRLSCGFGSNFRGVYFFVKFSLLAFGGFGGATIEQKKGVVGAHHGQAKKKAWPVVAIKSGRKRTERTVCLRQ